MCRCSQLFSQPRGKRNIRSPPSPAQVSAKRVFPQDAKRVAGTKMAKKSGDLAAFVGNEIACPVCLEIFNDPKCLPTCAHNVCVKCLHNIVRRNPRKTKVQCPECRKKSQIPPSGVAGFPTNHLLKPWDSIVTSSPCWFCKEYYNIINCFTETGLTYKRLRDDFFHTHEDLFTAAVRPKAKQSHHWTSF